MVTVYDIKNQPNPEIEDKFFEVIDDIIFLSGDRLKDNYIDLKTSYKAYAAFHVVVYEDEIVAFSGLQTDKFPAGHCRALTRTYYTEHARTKNLKPREMPSLASKYMLPAQVEVARQMGMTNIFISFEEKLGRKRFSKVFEQMLQEVYPDESWELLPGLYNTVPDSRNGSWQFIINNQLSPSEFGLELKSE